MEELDDLATYNGDTDHDIWVDFTSYEYTGQPDVFDDADIDDVIENLDDWD